MRGMQDEEWSATKVSVKSGTGPDLWSFIVHFIFISHGGSHIMQLFKVKKTP